MSATITSRQKVNANNQSSAAVLGGSAIEITTATTQEPLRYDVLLRNYLRAMGISDLAAYGLQPVAGAGQAEHRD